MRTPITLAAALMIFLTPALAQPPSPEAQAVEALCSKVRNLAEATFESRIHAVPQELVMVLATIETVAVMRAVYEAPIDTLDRAGARRIGQDICRKQILARLEGRADWYDPR